VEQGGAQQRNNKRPVVIAKSAANAAVAVEAVRYLEEDDWYERLEVQVKNVSNKPIYFLEVVLFFPDIVNNEIDGVRRTLTLPFTYGRRDLMRKGNRAKPEDSMIAPGESYVFKVPSEYAEMRDRLKVVKRIVARVDSVSFGDETGFMAGSVQFSFNKE
jgi:hypothetical protein